MLCVHVVIVAMLKRCPAVLLAGTVCYIWQDFPAASRACFLSCCCCGCCKHTAAEEVAAILLQVKLRIHMVTVCLLVQQVVPDATMSAGEVLGSLAGAGKSASSQEPSDSGIQQTAPDGRLAARLSGAVSSVSLTYSMCLLHES